MAFSHGKDFDVNLATAAAPTVVGDFSQYCNSCSFPQSRETAEATVFGNSSKAKLAGLRDSSFSLEGFYDPAASLILQDLLEYDGEDVDFEITPQVSGAVYSGHCICTSFEASGGVGDVVTWSAEFEITGDVLRTP